MHGSVFTYAHPGVHLFARTGPLVSDGMHKFEKETSLTDDDVYPAAGPFLQLGLVRGVDSPSL